MEHEECSDPIDANRFIYDYFFKDHLQNVRTVVATQSVNVYGGPISVPNPNTPGGSGSASAAMRQYRATMEVSVANTESLFWERLAEVRDLNPVSADPADTRSARLDGSDPDRIVGTAIMLRVMPGDQFDISSRSYYEKAEEPEEPAAVSPEDLATTLLNTLAGGSAVAGTVPVSELPRNQQILHSAFGGGTNFAGTLASLQDVAADPDKPQSFLNYTVLDENLHVVPDLSGVMQADGGEGSWVPRELGGPVTIHSAGYLVVFTSSRAARSVYWDQLTVTKWEGSVLEEDHYYPFGLTLSQASANPAERNNRTYQSIETLQ